MTYLSDEAAHKTPIELYQFTFGAEIWRMTDAESSFNHPVTGNTYTPEALSRSELNQSDEDGSMSIEVELDALSPVGQFFRTPFLTLRAVWLLVERTHAGAPGGEAPAVLFRGQVNQAVFDGNKITVTCIPTRQALSRAVPTVMVQTLCSNTLFDQRCQANPAAFRVSGVNISFVSGINITIPGHGKPDGYFSGGVLEVAGLPAATIREQVGTSFSLIYNYGYTVGMAVSLLPGCDKRFMTCLNKFNNMTHHQGMLNMPQIDPFVDPVT